jgi:hypothetical protein
VYTNYKDLDDCFFYRSNLIMLSKSTISVGSTFPFTPDAHKFLPVVVAQAAMVANYPAQLRIPSFIGHSRVRFYLYTIYHMLLFRVQGYKEIF